MTKSHIEMLHTILAKLENVEKQLKAKRKHSPDEITALPLIASAITDIRNCFHFNV